MLDDLDIKTTDYYRQNRISVPPTQRWIGAERDALKAVSHILTQLYYSQGQALIQEWVERGFFTAQDLFYRLAKQIAATLNQKKALKQIVRYFESLTTIDPLRLIRPNGNKDASFELAHIMQYINNIAESATDPTIHEQCRQWLVRFVPTLKDTNPEMIYQLDVLAYRLQFALSVALLDRHSQIVLWEWDNRPATISGEQPHRRIPPAMLNILPLPVTGRQFGTYILKNLDNIGKTNSLATFAYTNIGRYYVSNFHVLRKDLENRAGPNVLALSGTSYLPHSSKFHLTVPPTGVLLPEEKSCTAIEASRFSYLPQYNQDGKPIYVSGVRDKHNPIRGMVASLAGDYPANNGQLSRTLGELERLAKVEPAYWYDRARILLLVNSYEQAKWAAEELKSRWPDHSQIYYLTQGGTEDDDKNSLTVANELRRADIETFAALGGKILIAPMLSIGRGFNILNKGGLAAFGAVYFLTRPMPQPFDVGAIAQELNRRVFDWASNPEFSAWQSDGVYGRAQELRRLGAKYWRKIESRQSYKSLKPEPLFMANPRYDLAATTAGLVIQAVGRLLRGGVPFLAYFVDAAWAPNRAEGKEELDTPKTSLLVAMLHLLSEYVAEDKICAALYQPLAEALMKIENLDWNIGREENITWPQKPNHYR